MLRSGSTVVLVSHFLVSGSRAPTIDLTNLSCSGHFLTLLNCRLDQYDLGPTEDPVLVTADISQALLVTASSDGVVIVRNRRTFGSVYRESHHGDQAVVAVRLVEDLVVTGSRREVVVLTHTVASAA